MVIKVTCVISKRNRFCSFRLGNKTVASNRDKWLVVSTSVYSLIGFLIKKDLRLPIDFQSMRRSPMMRSTVDVNELFYLRLKGARCYRDTRRRGEQKELERWAERDRNFIPVTFTIGQTARYWPRECQPLEYRSPQRIDCGTRLWTFFTRHGLRWLDPPFSEKESVEITWLVEGRVMDISLSIVSKVPARSSNARIFPKPERHFLIFQLFSQIFYSIFNHHQ